MLMILNSEYREKCSNAVRLIWFLTCTLQRVIFSEERWSDTERWISWREEVSSGAILRNSYKCRWCKRERDIISYLRLSKTQMCSTKFYLPQAVKGALLLNAFSLSVDEKNTIESPNELCCYEKNTDLFIHLNYNCNSAWYINVHTFGIDAQSPSVVWFWNFNVSGRRFCHLVRWKDLLMGGQMVESALKKKCVFCISI